MVEALLQQGKLTTHLVGKYAYRLAGWGKVVAFLFTNYGRDSHKVFICF